MGSGPAFGRPMESRQINLFKNFSSFRFMLNFLKSKGSQLYPGGTSFSLKRENKTNLDDLERVLVGVAEEEGGAAGLALRKVNS